ncbi:hypothetical protein D3C79_935660 [compost metagenome]
MGNQVLFLHFADANINVEVLANQVHPTVHQLQPDVQIRMALAQQRQNRRHMLTAQTQAGADAQGAPWFAVRRRQRFEH